MRRLNTFHGQRRNTNEPIQASEAEQGARAVRNIIDDFNGLYMVVTDSPQSVTPTVNVMPSPVQRLQDSGIEPYEYDEIVSISGAWLDMRDCINHGEYQLDPSQLQARIDAMISRIANTSAI